MPKRTEKDEAHQSELSLLSMMLFFLPLGELLAMVGLPSGPAGLLRWIAEQLGVEVRMDQRTLKKALHSFENTPQTEAKLCEARGEMLRKCDLRSDEDLISPQSTHPWEWLADGLDRSSGADQMPRTRFLLRERLKQDTELFAQVRALQSDPQACFARLLHNPLTQVLNAEIDTADIVSALLTCRTSENIEEFVRTNHLLRRWTLHLSISLLMDLLACADVEFCASETLKDYPRRPDFAGGIQPLLPMIRDGKPVLPLRRLFERWRSLLGKKSWKDLVDRDPDRLRTFRRWIDNECYPSTPQIEEFITKLVPNEWERDLARMRYRVALLLTKLFKESRFIAEPQDCVQMFQTFIRHRQQHLAEQGDAPPAQP